MTPDIAIHTERLSKRYELGRIEQPRDTLRDEIAFAAARQLQRVRGWLRPSERRAHAASAGASQDRTLWALKDVSLDIRRGEVVGLIGRNGAGKSTLLKVLSRITQPTHGRAVVYGRMGTLLEVGTGFHQELTGRENTFLNGAILGMPKAEIRRKFDEIIAFAEVERFVDTPVKFYSSGMYVRLAFAVAAFLEPEILLIDEVLAVGDAPFQRKCLGKMGDVAREGRTVVFVSHNLWAVRSLCDRAVWLDGGEVRDDGACDVVVDRYLAAVDAGETTSLRSDDGDFVVDHVILRDDVGTPVAEFAPGSAITVEIRYAARRPVVRPYVWMSVSSRSGAHFAASMLLDGFRPDVLLGEGQIRCRFESLPLLPQQDYVVQIGIRESDGRTHLIRAADVCRFTVKGTASELGLTGDLSETFVATSCPVVVPYRWELPDGTVRFVDPLNRVGTL